MTDLYILNNQNQPEPMPEADLMRWGQWLDTAEASGRRIIGNTTLEQFNIKTFFGGCDNNWDGGTPLLFETRVNENAEKRDLYLRRYESWEKAEIGHQDVCRQISDELKNHPN
jgi:hypothetical protein